MELTIEALAEASEVQLLNLWSEAVFSAQREVTRNFRWKETKHEAQDRLAVVDAEIARRGKKVQAALFGGQLWLEDIQP